MTVHGPCLILLTLRYLSVVRARFVSSGKAVLVSRSVHRPRRIEIVIEL